MPHGIYFILLTSFILPCFLITKVTHLSWLWKIRRSSSQVAIFIVVHTLPLGQAAGDPSPSSIGPPQFSGVGIMMSLAIKQIWEIRELNTVRGFWLGHFIHNSSTIHLPSGNFKIAIENSHVS